MSDINKKLEGGTKVTGTSLTAPQDTPLISVITIVYNGERYLEQSIKSVLEQSYQPIEYIIIDGGSTDGSVDIIKKYEDSIYYWCSEPDQGISDAFNKGIAVARGRFIGLVNADDYYEPDALLHLTQHITPDVDIIYGKINYWENDVLINVKGGNHQHLLGGLRGMTMPHPATIIAKSLYDKIGGYDISYKNAMDYEFFLRASKAGATYKRIDAVISNFRSGGITSQQPWNAYREAARAKQSVLGFSKFKAGVQYYIYLVFITCLGDHVHRLNLNRFK